MRERSCSRWRATNPSKTKYLTDFNRHIDVRLQPFVAFAGQLCMFMYRNLFVFFFVRHTTLQVFPSYTPCISNFMITALSVCTRNSKCCICEFVFELLHDTWVFCKSSFSSGIHNLHGEMFTQFQILSCTFATAPSLLPSSIHARMYSYSAFTLHRLV